ncbi:MAG: Holliday junction branch migration protein RuvA [Candidatus Pacebacteria bacterium]|jgi:Holliday junction DNA helicase RuvA|nr:Holliday junction branch migration protein RuvA [Candidatus Paceibacterota bacterium]
MISYLDGTIRLRTDKYLIIDVGGIGYKVYTIPETLTRSKNNDRGTFFTYLAVRENAMELYGFDSLEELSFFEMLLDVSGIGPKGALGIVAVGSVASLKKAIASGDTSYLTKVSGIGKKTAEKIIIELRDKLTEHKDASGVITRTETDALEALRSLGYSQQEARDALKEVSSEITDTSARVKEALKILGKA